MATVTVGDIEHGIEWFTVTLDSGRTEEDCQCARCGSSCSFADCANCGGEGEIDDMDNFEWPSIYRCDWCRGSGGSWHCISGVEWCQANPMAGREAIESTAMSSEAWRDCD